MLLGELLVKAGKVTGRQVNDALDKQRQSTTDVRLGEVLVEEGMLSEEEYISRPYRA